MELGQGSLHLPFLNGQLRWRRDCSLRSSLYRATHQKPGLEIQRSCGHGVRYFSPSPSPSPSPFSKLFFSLPGSIMEGPNPETLKPLVAQAFPLFLELVGDPSIHVQDTAAWTIGRICDLVPEAIDPQRLQTLIEVLLTGLQRAPRVATNCAWVFSLLV